MVKRKFISTRLLKNGMRIDQSIVDGTGRALIARGAFLDDFQIDYLQSKGVNGVYIREGEEDPQDMVIPLYTQEVIQKTRVEDPKKVSLSESVRKRVGEGIQYLYSNTEEGNFKEASDNIASQLMDAIFENEAIAVDVDMLKVSDEYTFKHSVDVATMSMIIGRQYGLDKKEIRDIGIAGLLHDVGKSKIPNSLLNKPGRLDENEFELMKQHSLFGFQILKEKHEFDETIMRGVLQHHEKIDGSGYPLGVSREKIHPYARILAVADIYDALVTERPYKSAFSGREAVEMIMAMTQGLDMKAMTSFLESVILYSVDSIVRLSNGEYAKVVSNTPKYPLRPKVVGIQSGKVYDLATDLKCASILIL